MNDSQYPELLNAIRALRNATELGFMDAARRFEEVYARFDKMEERWDRRFLALETRMDDGFLNVATQLDDIRNRLTAVERP